MLDLNTGEVSALREIDISAMCDDMEHCVRGDPTKYNGFFQVEGCSDYAGTNLCDQSAVNIRLVSRGAVEELEHIFAIDEDKAYHLEFTDDLPKGAVLDVTPEPIAVTAEYKDKVNSWSLVSAPNMSAAPSAPARQRLTRLPRAYRC